jgi:hypothetical protein
MRKQNDPAHVVMPGVHRVASLLERWLLGTHQGGVSSEHLDAYLNEFTFRFNRRQRGHLTQMDSPFNGKEACASVGAGVCPPSS